MKKDIHIEEVKDVAVAAVKDGGPGEEHWSVYLLNLKKTPIKNVLVNSRGYGSEEKAEVKTSTLRFFYDIIAPGEYVMIEPIMKDLFSLNNEYWVSFYVNDEIQDKRFIFLAESIIEENMVKIPLMDYKGILIK